LCFVHAWCQARAGLAKASAAAAAAKEKAAAARAVAAAAAAEDAREEWPDEAHGGITVRGLSAETLHTKSARRHWRIRTAPAPLPCNTQLSHDGLWRLVYVLFAVESL
jgi:hypothetical protein